MSENESGTVKIQTDDYSLRRAEWKGVYLNETWRRITKDLSWAMCYLGLKLIC